MQSISATGRGLPLRSLSSRLSDCILSWVDGVIAFLVLERNLIVRDAHMASEAGGLGAYSNVFRALVVINAHIWLLWALGRGNKGATVSYITYYTAAFITWLMFSTTLRCAKPATIAAKFTKNINIKWLNLFIAAIIWECSKILLAGVITLSFYAIFPMPKFGTPVRLPNLLLLFCVLMITVTFGAGFGIIMRTSVIRWPMVEPIREVLRWFLFITSGIYITYASLPWFVAQYLWFQPLEAPIAYSRYALDSSYPLGDLSLTYSAGVAFASLFFGLGFRRWDQKNPRQ